MKQKLILLTFCMVLVLTSLTFATATIDAVVSDVQIEFNQQKLILADANNVEVNPLIVNGTTFLPVRAIGENLGLEVGWIGETKTVTLKKVINQSPTSKIEPTPSAHTISSKLQATVSDVIIELEGKRLALTDANGNEVKPLIVNGTTYLPIRAISESLGLSVTWNEETRTASLTTQTEMEAETETTVVVPPVSPTVVAGNQTLVPSDIKIKLLDKEAELIIIENVGSVDIDITGYRIHSVKGNQDYFFSNYVLPAGGQVRVGDSAKNTVDIHWLDGRKGIWNNSKSDPAELYNANGQLIDYLDK